MDKNLDIVLQNIRLGKFLSVEALIDKTQLNKHDAMQILCVISNSCAHDLCGKLQIDSNRSVVNASTVVTECIISPNKSQIVRYLQAIFHIYRFLINKECYEHLSKMTKIILASNTSDLKQESKAVIVYEQLIILLTNSLNKLLEKRNEKYMKFLPEIFKIILITKMQIHSTTLTLNLAKSIVSNFFFYNVKNEYLQEIYINILDMCIINPNVISNDHVEILLEIYSKLFCIYIAKSDDVQARIFLKNINAYLKKNLQDDHCILHHKILYDITNILSPVNETEALIETVKLQFKSIKTSGQEYFRKFLCFLVQCLQYLANYYNTNNWSNWDQVNTKTFTDLLRFFKNEILIKEMLIPKDSTEKNLVFAVLMAYFVLGGILQHIQKVNDLPEEFHSVTFDFVKHLYALLEHLKQYYNEKYRSLYKNVTKVVYNFGIILKCTSASLEYSKIHIKKIYESGESVPEAKYINASFDVICKTNYDAGEYEMCLAHAALYSLISKTDNTAIYWWTKSKEKLRSEPLIHKLTMIEILQKHSKVLDSIINPINLLTKDVKFAVLKNELQGYINVYKSKVPILITFTELYESSSMPQFIDVIVDVIGDNNINIPNENSSVLKEIYCALEKYLKNNNCNEKAKGRFALGIVAYCYYRTLRIDTVLKSYEEVNKTVQFVENANKDCNQDPEPKDRNDTCDIVSVYQNILLTKFMDVLEYLNQALKWFILVSDSNLETKYLTKLCKLLATVGQEYRLQSLSLRSICAFSTNLKVAKMIQDQDQQLLSIAFLIETANVNRSHVKLLIEDGDKLAQILQDENPNLYRNTLILYYILKANAFLYTNIEISHDAWIRSNQLYNECEKKGNDIESLYCKILILQFKFMTSNQSLAEKYSDQLAVLKLHDAMNLTLSLYRFVSTDTNPLYINIIFEVVYTVTKYYLSMRLPRDLRMYSKNIIILSQKLVLPMTTISFLVLLAHCDILTLKLDDSKNKLNGIKEILNLDDPNADGIDIITDEINKLSVDDTEILPCSSPSALYTVKQHFKLPNFLWHDKNCICFCCMTLEIQHAWLQLIHLKALHCDYAKDQKLAELFFNNFFKVYDIIQTNQDQFKNKLKRMIQKIPVPTFNYISLETHIVSTNDYSLHLSLSSKYKEALEMNTRSIRQIKERQNEFIYLYTDTLVHRLTFVGGLKETSKPMNKLPLSTKELNVPQENYNLKTPQHGKIDQENCPFDCTGYSTAKKNPHLKKCNLFKNKTSAGVFQTPKSKKTNEKVTSPETPFTKPFALEQTPCTIPKKLTIPTIALFNENGNVELKSKSSIKSSTSKITKSKTEKSTKSTTKNKNGTDAHGSKTPAEMLKAKIKRSIKQSSNDPESFIISNSPEQETSQRVTRSLARQLKVASEKKVQPTKDNDTQATVSCRRRLL